MRRVVDALPWQALKNRLAQWLARLPPYPTLLVFAVPLGIYLGLEALALWPLARGHWLTALVVLAAAKILGAALTAFAFDLTRDKLLQIGWFRAGYAIVLRWRDAAHALPHPSALLALAYVVVVATFFGFGVWTWLLSRYPASTVSPFTLLVPVVGIATAWVVRHEQPTGGELAGAFVVLIGLGLTTGVLRLPRVARESAEAPEPS